VIDSFFGSFLALFSRDVNAFYVEICAVLIFFSNNTIKFTILDYII